jgi:hypothetical protein
VIAKVDTTATPTRLIAIDKTVPGSINNATGVITAPTGTAVSGIASVTKNAVAFTNAGQFALSGTTGLVINPNLITQPAVGLTDTYVVTMNNSSGGGTTLATVVVSHGSVKIDSILMSSGTLVINTAAIAGVTAPETGATPATSVSGTGYTGTVTWSGSPSTFAYNTAYTATVTLTATSGYTFTGLAANFFTVAGTASAATNSANSGVVSAVFPTTGLPAGYISIDGLTWSPNNRTISSPGLGNYDVAVGACSAMNTANTLTYNNWRLPTKAELSNLNIVGISALNDARWTFNYTWSGDGDTGNHFVVHLGAGFVQWDGNSDNAILVSCVHP